MILQVFQFGCYLSIPVLMTVFVAGNPGRLEAIIRNVRPRHHSEGSHALHSHLPINNVIHGGAGALASPQQHCLHVHALQIFSSLFDTSASLAGILHVCRGRTWCTHPRGHGLPLLRSLLTASTRIEASSSAAQLQQERSPEEHPTVLQAPSRRSCSTGQVPSY